MPSIHRSALMPYSSQIMFEIVNDVASYPEFLPWCGGVKIISQGENWMDASILMKKGVLNHWFSTRNTIDTNKKIEMTLTEGPFKQLEGAWEFIALDPASSKVQLDLSFEASNSITSTLVAAVFTQIANTMVDSFCARAHRMNRT